MFIVELHRGPCVAGLGWAGAGSHRYIKTMSRHHEGKKLPPGWVKCDSAKYGAPYFFDTQTGKSLWFPPEVNTNNTCNNSNSNDIPHGAQQPPLPPSPAQPPLPPEDDRQHSAIRTLEEEGFSRPHTKRPRSDDSDIALAAEATAGGGNATGSATTAGGVKIAVIVPYRDMDPAQRRAEHLRRFVPYMESFLAGQMGASFKVFVVEQSADDGRKFNRGKLLNVGFDLARQEGCSSEAAFVFHDVDLLPSQELGM